MTMMMMLIFNEVLTPVPSETYLELGDSLEQRTSSHPVTFSLVSSMQCPPFLLSEWCWPVGHQGRWTVTMATRLSSHREMDLKQQVVQVTLLGEQTTPVDREFTKDGTHNGQNWSGMGRGALQAIFFSSLTFSTLQGRMAT